MSGNPGDDAIGALWLDEFGKLTSYVLHGLRNGLQGVGINLEVIRSRTENANATTADMRTFAVNASRQFEDVSAQVEALAFLCRDVPGGSGTEIGPTVKAIATLLNAGGKGVAGVVLEEAPIQARAAVGPVAARLLLTHVMMAAARSGSKVTCKTKGMEPVSVELQLQPAAEMVIGEQVLAVARGLHVRIDSGASNLTVTFPTTLSSDTVLV